MEHLSGVMSRVSCVIVSTPQAVAVRDAQKSVSFARAVNLEILGLIENMSGYVCPCCCEVSLVFSSGGVEELAEKEGVVMLGRVPIDKELVNVLDGGCKGIIERYKNTKSRELFIKIVDKLITL